MSGKEGDGKPKPKAPAKKPSAALENRMDLAPGVPMNTVLLVGAAAVAGAMLLASRSSK